MSIVYDSVVACFGGQHSVWHTAGGCGCGLACCWHPGISRSSRCPSNPATLICYVVFHGGTQADLLPEVLAAAGRVLGAEVAPEQPLMEAGLDSLGVLSVPSS